MDFQNGNFGKSLNALAELLQTEDKTPPGNLEVSQPKTAAPSGPGSVGPRGLIPGAKPPAVKTREGSQEIWKDDDLDDFGADDVDDGRHHPRYEFLYRQAVETTDAFLGMSLKDASSSCCEDMVLKVEMPGTESVAEIDLDVKDTSITVRSPKYKLFTYLPHKAKSDKGRAKWDPRKQELVVALPIVREDYLP